MGLRPLPPFPWHFGTPADEEFARRSGERTTVGSRRAVGVCDFPRLPELPPGEMGSVCKNQKEGEPPPGASWSKRIFLRFQQHGQNAELGWINGLGDQNPKNRHKIRGRGWSRLGR